MNGNWTEYSVKKITRWDFERYFKNEETRFYRHVFKPESWLIHQQGDRDAATEATVNATPGIQAPVKIYDRPVSPNGLLTKVGKYAFVDKTPRSGKMLAYNFLQDLAYDVIDTFMDPVEDLLESMKFLPVEETVRQLVFKEWHIATDFVRNGYRNTARRPLTYEIV